ncbi:hypothetical protein CEJ42_16945 [Herbaspirillum robiniae]|uniref:Uncharacterized protein n=1 Tax=Herbaspirillum robiniae TaxID=2014887 RepID=A0A246WN41_9BURK|nr:hypothetical protein CEJ42_16945 [Herbaspirillum robiniae]
MQTILLGLFRFQIILHLRLPARLIVLTLQFWFSKRLFKALSFVLTLDIEKIERNISLSS